MVTFEYNNEDLMTIFTFRIKTFTVYAALIAFAACAAVTTFFVFIAYIAAGTALMG